MKTQKGFTLVELMVSIAMMAVLSGIMIGIVYETTVLQVSTKNKVEGSTDRLLGEHIIFMDMKNIDPSFNVLKQPDDSGKNFFDHIPDVPESFLGDRAQRTMTLKQGGLTEIRFLQVDPSAGPMLIYDPMLAYQLGEVPASFNEAAPLTFISLNQEETVSKSRPYFWQPGRMLMLDTPARIRPAVGNQIDLSVPPRSPAFVGTVSDAHLLQNMEIAGAMHTTHPLTGAPINSADVFLRTIPSVGGGAAFVRLRAVRIIRYSFQKTDTGHSLFRSIYADGKYERDMLVSDKLDSVTFYRKSINQKILQFSLEKDQSRMEVKK